MRKRTPESQVKADIRRTCAYLGVWITAIVGGPFGQRPGLPDYMGCHKGRFLCIEAKAKGNKLSAHQEIIKAEVEAAGGLYVVAYSGLDVCEALGVPTLVNL